MKLNIELELSLYLDKDGWRESWTGILNDIKISGNNLTDVYVRILLEYSKKQDLCSHDIIKWNMTLDWGICQSCNKLIK